MSRDRTEAEIWTSYITRALIVATLLIVGGLWGCPQYHVYQQTLVGKAKLAEAESSKQIMTTEAHAKRESATLLAEAEVERAKGVAKANEIIGQSLGGQEGEAYLRYLWIQNLAEGKNEVIYVPTEANLPILEAGRAISKGREIRSEDDLHQERSK